MFLASIGTKSSESCRCGTFPANGASSLFSPHQEKRPIEPASLSLFVLRGGRTGLVPNQQSEERNDRRISADFTGNEPLQDSCLLFVELVPFLVSHPSDAQADQHGRSDQN